MAINLARTTCRAPGPNNRRRRSRKQRENSAKFLPTLARLILLGVGVVGDQAHLLSSFALGFHFPILEVNVSRSTRRRERDGGKNQSAFVGLHQMDVGGREGEGGGSERGEARNGEGEETRRLRRERPKSGGRGMHELRQRDRGSGSCSTGCSS